MKKLLSLVAVAAMAVTLTGCKDATAEISDGDKALVTVGGEKITKEDVYKTSKKAYGASYTLNEALNIITDKEKIELTDEMKKKADEQMKTLKESAGDDFAKQLKDNGYKNEDDYKKKEIYPNLRQQGLVKNYVISKKDAMFKTYAPRKAEILQADSKEKAEAALKAVKDGTSMKDAATANGNTTTYKGEEAIYTTKSSLPTAVFDKIKGMKEAGLVDSVIEDATNQKYYVIKVTETDPAKFESDALDKIVETGSTDLATASSVFYLNKYDFKVYDKDVYDGLKAVNEKYVEN